MAKMYGCDAIADNQSNIPAQQYESRYEIRKTLARLLETIFEEATPRSDKEATLIQETRQQLQELLLQLRSDAVELPALLPNDKVQALLKKAFASAVEITRDIERSAAQDIRGRDRTHLDPPQGSSLEGQTNRVDLDQSAIQQLKLDFQEELSNFQAILGDLGNDSAVIEQVGPRLSGSYNSIVLYASILDSNGYRTPGLREFLNAYLEQMCALAEGMGGDMFSIRTLRSTARPFPPNQSSLDETNWNALMQQYDEAVHQMAIAEQVAERLMPRFGEEYACRMLIGAYNAFIKTAREIQGSTGELRHYLRLKGVLAPQLHRLAEAIEFPVDELEVM